LFSTIEVVSKWLGGGIHPNAITAWRFLIGGAVILPLAIRQIKAHKTQLGLGSILRIGALGILNVCISMLLLQWSVLYGKASLSAILVALNPLFVSLFAFIILKERLGFATKIGLASGLIGLLLIVLGEQNMLVGYKNLPLGIGLALGAALTFGLYTVLGKSLVARHGNLAVNSLSFVIGSLGLFVISFFLGVDTGIRMSLNNLAVVAYFFEALKKLPASTVSMYFFFKPVIASLLAWVLTSERLSIVQIVGIAVVIGSQVMIRTRVFKSPVPLVMAEGA
jgi:drug/metabolite transporter (DMT)-like permease